MKKFLSLVLAMLIVVGATPAYATTNFKSYGQIEQCNMTAAQTQTVKDFIDSFIEEHNVKNMTRSEQLAELAVYLCGNVEYDYDYIRENRTAYALVTKGLTVCVGYTQLAYMYCEALEIPCDIVFNSMKTAPASETHVMNMVQMEDGLWYYLDYTESVPENSNGFLFGEDTANAYYRWIVKKTSYSDISGNEVSKEDYLTKYKRHEDPNTNVLRTILKALSAKGYIIYHERPGSINALYNGQGWVIKGGEEVFKFNFYYNEDNYGPLGCWYN